MSPTQAQSVANDGWTVITRKGKPQPSLSTQKPLPDKDLTVEKLKVGYDKCMRTWRASACRRGVRQILDRKQPDDGWQIKEAICMATGSFSRDNWEHQKRSMCQFVAFMDTVQYLQATSSETIDIFAQELIYTEVDNDFLSQMGITVYNVSWTLSGPYITNSGASVSDHLGSASFVFEPFMEFNSEAVRHLVTSRIRLLIGSAVPNVLAHYPQSDAEIRRFLNSGWTPPDYSENSLSNESVDNLKQVLTLYKRFDSEYSTYYFPRFEEDPNIFEGLRIAWMIPKDETDDD